MTDREPIPTADERLAGAETQRVVTEEQLMRVVHALAPLAFMDQADDGELVIFTRLRTDEDGSLAPLE